jgi:hypothetical protein
LPELFPDRRQTDRNRDNNAGLETVVTVLSIPRRTKFAQNFFPVLWVPDPEAVTDLPWYQGTTSQLAEKLDFLKVRKMDRARMTQERSASLG